jgi:hypothetical protein
VIFDVPTLPMAMTNESPRHRHARCKRRTAPSRSRTSCRHAEHVAQHPVERRVAIDIDLVRVSVDFNDEGHSVVTF